MRTEHYQFFLAQENFLTRLNKNQLFHVAPAFSVVKSSGSKVGLNHTVLETPLEGSHSNHSKISESRIPSNGVLDEDFFYSS